MLQLMIGTQCIVHGFARCEKCDVGLEEPAINTVTVPRIHTPLALGTRVIVHGECVKVRLAGATEWHERTLNPKEGMIVGMRMRQNGDVDREYDGGSYYTIFTPTGRFPTYLVATGLGRKHLICLQAHLEVVE